MMKQLSPQLYQSPPEHPFSNAVMTCAYLLRREAGNLLLYSSSRLKQEEDEIRKLGGITHQYLNHRDEASESCQWVTDTFNAPLTCHESEKAAVSEHCTVAATFDGQLRLHDDLEAVPTPGHCPGSSCYLWQAPDRRYLFTGDTIYLKDGSWQVFVNRGTSDQMIDSLGHIQNLEFDVLVPGLFIGEVSHMGVTQPEVNEQIERVIERLRRGEIH